MSPSAELTWITGAGEHAGERRERHAAAVGAAITISGTLMPKACTSGAFSVAARSVAPRRVRSITNQVLKHTDERRERSPRRGRSAGS